MKIILNFIVYQMIWFFFNYSYTLTGFDAISNYTQDIIKLIQDIRLIKYILFIWRTIVEIVKLIYYQ